MTEKILTSKSFHNILGPLHTLFRGVEVDVNIILRILMRKSIYFAINFEISGSKQCYVVVIVLFTKFLAGWNNKETCG